MNNNKDTKKNPDNISKSDLSINEISNNINKSETNKEKDDFNELKSDIDNSLKLKNALTDNSSNKEILDSIPLIDTITKTNSTLKNLNSIKEEICLLPLDPCEKNYYNNSIQPLLQTLDLLTRASVDLATSVTILTTSPIVPRKKSKLKNSIELIYDLNEKCEDVYDVVRKRIDILINYNCNCK